MNVERKRETMPVLVAAVDNDRMALLALKGILPQLLPSSQWLWGTGDADEAVAKALSPETRPRLLLVDMSLGEATGVSVCRKIRTRTDRVLLLGITAFSVETYAERIAAAGAQGIVSKADIPQLAQALRTVAAGGTFMPRPMASTRSIASPVASRASASSAPLASSLSSASSASFASPAGNPTFRAAAEAHRLLADGGTITPGRATGATDTANPDSAVPATDRTTKLGAKEAETLYLLSRGMTYDQIATQWGVASSTVRTHAHRAVDKLGAHSLAHAIAIWLSR
ncbi:DNA-binding response regulator [Bifidobacterium myosotis]|uniref:DNA-binding response regulator n=1 Tax=Bifidobacterium myosotis TaxID=1630166 RepID=A0A261FL71_9BIFI|nr:LuxR C-terminal-related transcriptional regulator [Bifidobacterium myosotis]OZG59838.1 DNA-binding response regulator [Bifidobacterium myosotis]